MTNYNPRNERTKRDYFILLKQADQMADATVDGIRKALCRYEEFAGYEDFASFEKERAIGFKKHLTKLSSARSGKPLSHATIYSTVQGVQAFFRWLSRLPGYRSRIVPSDIRYLNLSRKDVAIATSNRTKRFPTLEQVNVTLASMSASTEVEMRDRALFAFAILTGIRDSAISSLRLKHVDIHQRLVIQDPSEVKTKFSKRIETFFFPVGPQIERIVTEWVTFLREEKLYGNDDPLFPRTKVVANKVNGFIGDGLEPTP